MVQEDKRQRENGSVNQQVMENMRLRMAWLSYDEEKAKRTFDSQILNGSKAIDFEEYQALVSA